MMVSAEFLGYEPRIWGLIEIGVPKSDGKCFYRLRIGSRHQSYDRRRIRAPTEHGSQRNICDQTNAHRLGKPLFHLVQQFFFAVRIIRTVFWQVPVLPNVNLTLLKLKQMSWR